MASTDYDFSATRDSIIKGALGIIGAIPLGNEPSAEQYDDGQRVLNSIVKNLQNEHIFLWTITPKTLSLTAATAYYALGADPPIVGLDRAYLRDTAGNDTRIQIISYREYQEIVDKDATGDPTVVCVDNAKSLTLWVWPVQTATRTLLYHAIIAAKDWDTSSATADFPVRWQYVLEYLLAADMNLRYGVNNPAIEKKAQYLLQRAKANDFEYEDITQVEGAF